MIRFLVAGSLSAILAVLLVRNPLTVLTVLSSLQVLAAIMAFVIGALLSVICTLQWRAGFLVAMVILCGVCAAIGFPLVASIPLFFAIPALVSLGTGLCFGDSWTGRPC